MLLIGKIFIWSAKSRDCRSAWSGTLRTLFRALLGLPYIPVKINHNIIPSRSKYFVSTAILNSPSLLCFASSLVFAILTQSGGGGETCGKDAGMGAGRLIGNSGNSGTDTVKLSLSRWRVLYLVRSNHLDLEILWVSDDSGIVLKIQRLILRMVQSCMKNRWR
jgi:hypothetical protein